MFHKGLSGAPRRRGLFGLTVNNAAGPLPLQPNSGPPTPPAIALAGADVLSAWNLYLLHTAKTERVSSGGSSSRDRRTAQRLSGFSSTVLQSSVGEEGFFHPGEDIPGACMHCYSNETEPVWFSEKPWIAIQFINAPKHFCMVGL